MITEALAGKWQKEKAPWRNNFQVEHDLVLSRALIEMYQSPLIQKTLAFRGGTALNKLFLNPPARYSEDLDFVRLEQAPAGDLIDGIRASLDSWLGTPARKRGQQSVKLVYKYPSISGEYTKLKIEINVTELFHINPLQHIVHEIDTPWFKGSAKVLTYDFHELMASKLRALYQRRKGRDLFDMWYVLKQGLIDTNKLFPIFDQISGMMNVHMTRALFEENLDSKYNHPDFRIDMNNLLAIGEKWDFEKAFQTVHKEIVEKFPGDPWLGKEEKEGEK